MQWRNLEKCHKKDKTNLNIDKLVLKIIQKKKQTECIYSAKNFIKSVVIGFCFILSSTWIQ